MADLEVVGRHALLFDDDATAEFVNSAAALVDWNSLSIDRYDVRHLLSAPPPSRRRRHPSSPTVESDVDESELDRERWLDLPGEDEQQQQEEEEEKDNAEKSGCSGGYNAVPFSYGSADASADLKNTNAVIVYCPPFPVPDNLRNNLPPTEKLHQIIARTAIFVSKHGGQSEIILRVKQGDNPTFGFLMPDNHLHPYFRYLVEHQELLTSDTSDRSQEGGNKDGGALSLLGSVYGSGEDEDGVADIGPHRKPNDSSEKECPDGLKAEQSEQMESFLNSKEGEKQGSKNPPSSLKEKVTVIKRNQGISNVKVGTKSRTKKDGKFSASTAGNKFQGSALESASKAELPILEPPSEQKRVIEKIVEFILKNGKEFEAVLIEQDSKHGRFPFLLPSDKFHSYYLKVLQKAQESKFPEKSSSSKASETLSDGDNDVPSDFGGKQKFKMVLGKSKKDGQDLYTQDTQPQIEVSVDAVAAAAILQAATRGIRNPNLNILSKPTVNGVGQGHGSDGKQISSSGSFPSSQTQGCLQQPDQNSVHGVAKAIAKTAAVAAASEADSSEVCVDKEQKLKAERLKRAKMFAALIKSGAAPLPSEPVRGLSVEPAECGDPDTGTDVANFGDKEREGSSVPVDASDKIEKLEETNLGDECSERLAKRRYRVRSRKNDMEEDDDDKDDSKLMGKEKEVEKEDSGKLSRKGRSDSSHQRRDTDKHKRKHSSSRDRDSRREHKHKHSDSKHHHSRHEHKHKHSDSKRHHSRHRHKHDRSADEREDSHCHHNDSSSSSDEHRRSRAHRKYNSSSDEDHKGSRHRHRRSRRRHRHNSSSDDETELESRSVKRKTSHSERELEEGEISTKSDRSIAGEGGSASREASVDISKSDRKAPTQSFGGASREASVDISKSEGKGPSQPSEVNEVSDDLRAKIRAMLLATL